MKLLCSAWPGFRGRPPAPQAGHSTLCLHRAAPVTRSGFGAVRAISTERALSELAKQGEKRPRRPATLHREFSSQGRICRPPATSRPQRGLPSPSPCGLAQPSGRRDGRPPPRAVACARRAGFGYFRIGGSRSGAPPRSTRKTPLLTSHVL